MHERRTTPRCPVTRPLVGIAVTAMTLFTALTVVVTSNSSLTVDSRAFKIADQLRAPWLDHVARLLTTLGLIAVVGPALLLGAAVLIRHRHRARAATLLAGGTLTWIGAWITKLAVDRPRPQAPLVHATGQSYPSAHAANSVGWLALAIALTITIPNRRGRIITIECGALLTVLVGLSRIYLRAHYASDVLGGQALAIAMYAFAALGALTRRGSPRISRLIKPA